ncbi:MAG TPA: dihydroorotase [Clostridiaceae bacterium]|nr:dihydroorotase [Clostridiaceae bacterium]
MELLVKGARVVDSSQDFEGDVYIRNGKIDEIGKRLSKDCSVIDGKGLTILPAFVDLHSHFRDPGQTYKEDILSGSRAAAAGGYTAVNLMANTDPPCSSMEIVGYVKNKADEAGLIDVYQSISITKNMEGNDISHLEKIDKGVKIISDDGKGVLSIGIMYKAMVKAKDMGIIVMTHEEDESIAKYDARLSENIMTIRDIVLSEYTLCPLHIAHVSTKEAMKSIMDAKKRGVPVTCEVTPHHISLDNSVDYKVNPPLRDATDVKFLIESIKDGFVDVISTDHAPHTMEDKRNGARGISGLETAFCVCFTKLVHEGNISLSKLSEIMSKNPARILKLNKGEIKIGYDGDLVLVDLNKKIKVDAKNFESKGKNTPFDGMEFYGKVLMTVKGGRVIYDNRQAL